MLIKGEFLFLIGFSYKKCWVLRNWIICICESGDGVKCHDFDGNDEKEDRNK